jgi:hypothetical protein
MPPIWTHLGPGAVPRSGQCAASRGAAARSALRTPGTFRSTSRRRQCLSPPRLLTRAPPKAWHLHASRPVFDGPSPIEPSSAARDRRTRLILDRVDPLDTLGTARASRLSRGSRASRGSRLSATLSIYGIPCGQAPVPGVVLTDGDNPKSRFNSVCRRLANSGSSHFGCYLGLFPLSGDQQI